WRKTCRTNRFSAKPRQYCPRTSPYQRAHIQPRSKLTSARCLSRASSPARDEPVTVLLRRLSRCAHSLKTGRRCNRVLGAAGFAFEESSLLDGQRLVEHIALDMARGLQRHAIAANGAHDAAANYDVLSNDAAGNLRLFADD